MVTIALLHYMHARPRFIIVVEDELLIRMLAAEALTGAGFSVIEADHADAALAILQARADEIGALFTDVNMPGAMDGLELARHASARWPWVRLLVASGRLQPAFTALPSGCIFLPKPYDPDCMVSQIRDLTMAG